MTERRTDCKPTEKQLQFMDWEMGAFFHFGIRSCYPGHQDWDNRPMPADAFCPADLDPDRWIATVKEAGCRYAVLTCKHHDGFCNWPSAYSTYTVRQTPWMDGKGDVVKLFCEACRRHGLAVGLYYSPAQWGEENADFQSTDYDDYFIAQITELLTQYGKIDYLWFDGCGAEGHVFDRARIIRTIRSLQPEILIFNMWDPDTRWCGNEEGYAEIDNCNLTDRLPFSMQTDDLEQLHDIRFLPAECDLKMRSTWFDDDNADTVKTPEELLGLWEYSVGRGANMLINIGPNAQGLLPAPDAESLLYFGHLLRQKWSTPLPFRTAQRSANTYVLTADLPLMADGLILQEDLKDGQHITGFSVHLTLISGRELCIYRSSTVGHKRVCTFPAVKTAKITVHTEGETPENPLIRITAHYTRT